MCQAEYGIMAYYFWHNFILFWQNFCTISMTIFDSLFLVLTDVKITFFSHFIASKIQWGSEICPSITKHLKVRFWNGWDKMAAIFNKTIWQLDLNVHLLKVSHFKCHSQLPCYRPLEICTCLGFRSPLYPRLCNNCWK